LLDLQAQADGAASVKCLQTSVSRPTEKQTKNYQILILFVCWSTKFEIQIYDVLCVLIIWRFKCNVQNDQILYTLLYKASFKF
jgi:hypothetical protein